MAAHWEPIRHTDLTEQVYDQVRARILSRVIKNDEQILVHEVAEELGVSRTPVIDAVKRLAAEGLVEVRARRGSFVRGLAEQDVHEIFELREALEVSAARTTMENGGSPALAGALTHWLGVMRGLMRDSDFGNYAAFTEADHAFHAAIIGSRGNRRSDKIYENLRVHIHVARAHLFRDLEPAVEVHADHTRIRDAVEAGDAVAAQAAIRGHLAIIRERVIANVRANNGSI